MALYITIYEVNCTGGVIHNNKRSIVQMVLYGIIYEVRMDYKGSTVQDGL